MNATATETATRDESAVDRLVEAVIDNVEMGAYLGVFRLLANGATSEQLLEIAARASELLQPETSEDSATARRYVERAQRLAGRLSRIIPGTVCLHRALGARVWLARRGVASEIVVGFRNGEELEGHAWLELDLEDGVVRLFVSEGSGYREVLRG